MTNSHPKCFASSLLFAVLLAGSCRGSRTTDTRTRGQGDSGVGPQHIAPALHQLRPVILRGVEKGDAPDTTDFFKTAGLTSRGFARVGGAWKSLPDTLPGMYLTLWRSAEGEVRVATMTEGSNTMALRFAKSGTLVEKSWIEGPNGCAENANIILRYLVRDGRVVAADRRVINPDGYEMSDCFLGVDDLDSAYVTWPALAAALRFRNQ